MYTSCMPVFMYTRCMPVSMYTSCMSVFMYTSCMLVSMYTSCMSVSMYTSCMPVSMYTSCMPVFMYTSEVVCLYSCTRRKPVQLWVNLRVVTEERKQKEQLLDELLSRPTNRLNSTHPTNQSTHQNSYRRKENSLIWRFSWYFRPADKQTPVSCKERKVKLMIYNNE